MKIARKNGGKMRKKREIRMEIDNRIGWYLGAMLFILGLALSNLIMVVAGIFIMIIHSKWVVE